MAEVTGRGFVLAGGRSRRMGRDKATLRYGPLTLVERSVRTLTEAGLDVTVLVRPGQALPGYRLLEDARPGSGPLGAIWTALCHSDEAVNCFLPCDMPYLPSRLFVSLARHAGDCDVVVATDTTGRTHHLCALLGPGCRQAAEQLLAAGRLRADGLLRYPGLRCRRLGPDEHGLADSVFRNLNYPGDLP